MIENGPEWLWTCCSKSWLESKGCRIGRHNDQFVISAIQNKEKEKSPVNSIKKSPTVEKIVDPPKEDKLSKSNEMTSSPSISALAVLTSPSKIALTQVFNDFSFVSNKCIYCR